MELKGDTMVRTESLQVPPALVLGKLNISTRGTAG